MRILFTTFYPARFGMGGAEQVMLDLCRSMKERFGEEVACAANPGILMDLLKQAGVRPLVEIPPSKWRTFETLGKYRRLISEFRPDVIHSFHRYATFLLDLFFKRVSPLLYTEEVLRKDKRLFFRYGRLAVACHETVGENLVAHYGVPPERLRVIANAVRPQIPNPHTLEALGREYSRASGEVWALCVGRLEEQKGHCYLIDAVSRMGEAHRSRIRIFLAGDGSLAPLLKQKVARAGLNGQIIFLGHTGKIPEFLTLCDFLVLPSLWEGLPLCLLEAYSAGKAVIATDIPGSHETVKHNQTGLLVSPRDPEILARAMTQFMDHPEEVQRMGREAFARWKEKFSFEEMTSAYHRLYQEILWK